MQLSAALGRKEFLPEQVGGAAQWAQGLAVLVVGDFFKALDAETAEGVSAADEDNVDGLSLADGAGGDGRLDSGVRRMD